MGESGCGEFGELTDDSDRHESMPRRARNRVLAPTPPKWHSKTPMTARELLLNAMALPEAERVKLAAELLASVPTGAALSAPAWESAWLAEVEEREALEPDDSLSAEHELPAVRQRLLGLFR